MSNIVSSDFNLERVSTEQLSEHIYATIKMEGNLAVFGRRGSGKTEIAKQQILKSNSKEVYINLSVLERVDMGGYPNVMSAGSEKFISVILPKFYESMIDGNENVVALLDEVDKADSSLWAPLLEFCQFKTINGIPLKNLKSVIMTGNLVCEGGNKPSSPLLDRCEAYLLEADATSWLKWAGANKIHASVLAFIADNITELFGNVDPEDRYKDPSPRGWHRASNIIYKCEDYNWNSDLLCKKISGCVGKEAGNKYAIYYKYYQELLPLINDIFQGKDIIKQYEDMKPTMKIVATMMACSRFTTELDKNLGNNKQLIINVGKFLNQVSEEDSYISIRTQIELIRIFKYNLNDYAEWNKIFDKFKSVEF